MRRSERCIHTARSVAAPSGRRMPNRSAASGVHHELAYTRGVPSRPSHRSTSLCSRWVHESIVVVPFGSIELDSSIGFDSSIEPVVPEKSGSSPERSGKGMSAARIFATSGGTVGSLATSSSRTASWDRTSTTTLASVRSCRCLVTLPSLRSIMRHGAASSGAIAPRAIAKSSSNSQDVERNAGHRLTPLPLSNLYLGVRVPSLGTVVGESRGWRGGGIRRAPSRTYSAPSYVSNRGTVSGLARGVFGSPAPNCASPAPSGASRRRAAGDDAEDDGERWDAGDGAVLSAAPSSRFFFPFAPEPPLR